MPNVENFYKNILFVWMPVNIEILLLINMQVGLIYQLRKKYFNTYHKVNNFTFLIKNTEGRNKDKKN